MDAWLATHVLGNTVQEWLTALAIILFTAVMARFLFSVTTLFLKPLAARSQTRLDDILIDMFEEPAVLAIVLLGSRFAIETLELSELAISRVEGAYHILVAVNVAWFFTRTYDAVHEQYLKPWVAATKDDADDVLLPLVRSAVKAVIWIVGVLFGLNNAGFDIFAVMASLGVGGLAFALAAQDAVANVFGGITVLSQRPFHVGDRIRVGDHEGDVKEIGLRTTVLKTWQGELVHLPNKIFTDTPVVNRDARKFQFMQFTLPLHPGTPVERIPTALAAIASVGVDDPRVGLPPVAVVDHVKDGCVVVVGYFAVKRWVPGDPEPGNWLRKTQARSDLYVGVLQALERAGVALGAPASMYLAQDPTTGPLVVSGSVSAATGEADPS